MKKFENADVVVLNLSATAFGPEDDTYVDDVKHAIFNDAGEIIGWEEEYGKKQS